MTEETLTTKKKLKILKEFWEHWREMSQYYFPERIEAAVLLWLYGTLAEEEWIESWTKDDLVKAFENLFTEEYIEELEERSCKTKQDYILLSQWIGFCWGLLSEDEDIYQVIEDTREAIALTKETDKKDLPQLFEAVYWTIEKEENENEIEKIKKDIKRIRS